MASGRRLPEESEENGGGEHPRHAKNFRSFPAPPLQHAHLVSVGNAVAWPNMKL
jgi:hypothetical protein